VTESDVSHDVKAVEVDPIRDAYGRLLCLVFQLRHQSARMAIQARLVLSEGLRVQSKVPRFASDPVIILVTLVHRRYTAADVTSYVPNRFLASGHGSMDKRNRICAVHIHLAWPGSDNVRIVLLVPFFGFLVVLVVWWDTYDDGIELGESCEKRIRNLQTCKWPYMTQDYGYRPSSIDERTLDGAQYLLPKRRNTEQLWMLLLSTRHQ
jgi:hypothetical protein